MMDIKRKHILRTILFLILNVKGQEARELLSQEMDTSTIEPAYFLGVVEGKKYFSTNETTSHNDAFEYCDSLQMSLAKITSTAEEEFLGKSWNAIYFDGVYWFDGDVTYRGQCEAYYSQQEESEIGWNRCSQSWKVLCERKKEDEITENPSTTTEGTTPREPTTLKPTTTTENHGDLCDPDDILFKGSCISFSRCGSDGRLITEKCEGRQFWERYQPDCLTLVPSGGECVEIGELCDRTKEENRVDENCLKSRFEAVGECQRNYRYLPPDAEHPRDTIEWICRSENNVFDPEESRCRSCHLVFNRETGRLCCPSYFDQLMFNF